MFFSKNKLSAAQIFGSLNHVNNSDKSDFDNGVIGRYKLKNDASYGAEILIKRINTTPPKDHLNVKKS